MNTLYQVSPFLLQLSFLFPEKKESVPFCPFTGYPINRVRSAGIYIGLPNLARTKGQLFTCKPVQHADYLFQNSKDNFTFNSFFYYKGEQVFKYCKGI